MNPLLLGLGGLNLAGLFGLSHQNSQQELYRLLSQIAGSLGPRTDQLYQQFVQSPAYSQGIAGAARAGNQLQSDLASSLASRGLLTSGIGTIAQPLAGFAASNAAGRYRAGAYDLASQRAMELIRALIAGISGTQSGPSPFQQGFGGLLGGANLFALNRLIK